MDGFEPIAIEYSLAIAQPFKALDLLFALLDLAFGVLGAEPINFTLAIWNNGAVFPDQLNVVSAETTLVGALVAVYCVFKFCHELSPALGEDWFNSIISES